ncbi:hypothetical protein GS474_11885 [Rhodococcus hoagii]|nr:hypothetical protein [Prescottella equi]
MDSSARSRGVISVQSLNTSRVLASSSQDSRWAVTRSTSIATRLREWPLWSTRVLLLKIFAFAPVEACVSFGPGLTPR